MKFHLSTFRLIAHVLLAAILLQAAGPILAAYQQKTGANWTEICSTSGSKWVASTDVDKSSGAGVHVGSDHCVFCGSTGATREFNASRYLPAFPPSNQPVSGLQCDPASRYAGHSILSRAPPLLLI